MQDKIIIDGVLYEKVVKTRGYPLKGKFNQITDEVKPDHIAFSILENNTKNSSGGENLLLSIDWVKGKGYKEERAAVSDWGIDESDEECVDMFSDPSKRKVMDACKYVLKLDAKRDRPWDYNSIEKLRKDLYRRFDLINEDDWYGYYVGREWRQYMEGEVNEYWRGVISGEYPLDFNDRDLDTGPWIQL